ncbi:MAG: PH domain-containing protein [bacterium]|nr:PH domain-containing protein [bacterium]
MITLLPNEHHLFTFRKHPIVLLPAILALIFLALAPLGIAMYLTPNINISIEGDVSQLLTFLYVSWLTLLWLAFSVVFVDYWLDMWVVTNKRLLDFEQLGLFNREAAVMRIEHIQDVLVETKGVLATFLHYGDIHVQTAGTNKEFVLHNMSTPIRIKNKLLQLQNDQN